MTVETSYSKDHCTDILRTIKGFYLQYLAPCLMRDIDESLLLDIFSKYVCIHNQHTRTRMTSFSVLHVTDEFKNKACSHISKHQCSVRTVKLVQIIDNIRVRPRYKNSILVYLEKDQTSIKLYLYREMAA